MVQFGTGTGSDYGTGVLDTKAVISSGDVITRNFLEDLQDAIIAIETLLGAAPENGFASVQLRLADLVKTETVAVAATAGESQRTATFSNAAGARIVGVTVEVTTGLGNGNGLTGFDVGNAVLLEHWGTGVSIALSTTTSSADFQSGDQPLVAANYEVLITAIGGTFDGTGAIDVKLHYTTVTH